ncbi:MAG TPA: hypothetical protein PLX06_00590 [Fimbriimonadaceae bacterium]|nr:hypothetical protein [Fimbriimonadaceae bacterium]
MKTTIFATLVACLALAFAGCTPKEEAGTTGAADAKAETNATPAPENKGTAEGESGAVASLAKCDGCGAEMDKALLTAHDGQNLCAKCIEAHGH